MFIHKLYQISSLMVCFKDNFIDKVGCCVSTLIAVYICMLMRIVVRTAKEDTSRGDIEEFFRHMRLSEDVSPPVIQVKGGSHFIW